MLIALIHGGNVQTGFIPPTSGTAYINSLDIRTDIDRIRESMGLCPQHNVLFESLSVEENLGFFAVVCLTTLVFYGFFSISLVGPGITSGALDTDLFAGHFMSYQLMRSVWVFVSNRYRLYSIIQYMHVYMHILIHC